MSTIPTSNLLLVNQTTSELSSPEVFDTSYDSFPLRSEKESTKDLRFNIQGPTSLQTKLKDLLNQNLNLFRKDVSDTPANIPPMELEVDCELWDKPENGGPPRVQSTAKQMSLHETINKLIRLNVIRASQAHRYSQVHLVPKTDKSWRMCIDFRRLNKVSQSLGWPLPNIQEMLRRIGQHKPKFFATIDLTPGYHQMPISVASSKYTAFITFMGIFEWLRVPMGLKGAASYFQQIMANIVLVGLLYIFLEVYLDDIIIFAQTEEELIDRLQQVFDRLNKHNIFLNPDKCVFGSQEIVYVGHTINEFGTTFSRGKLDEIIKYRDLTIQKDLKQFLGLCNWVSSHIKDYAHLARPLHRLITPYHPRRIISWDDNQRNSLASLKTAIDNCATLFLIDSNSPVHMNTDASDYGIGAYLNHIIEEKEHPIGFMR